MIRVSNLVTLRTHNESRWQRLLHNETVGPSEDRRSAVDLAIIREDSSFPQMFLRWVDGKAQVADA